MGDRVSTTFQLFGRLPHNLVPRLIELLEADVPLHTEPHDVAAKHEFDEVNYGLHEGLHSFALTHGLGYYHTWGAGREFRTGILVQQTNGTAVEACVNEQGDACVSLANIKKYNLNNFEDVVTHLGKFEAPVPPLEIIHG